MAGNILIVAGEVSMEAELNDGPTAGKILDALPIEGSAQTWGDEIYFSIPVTSRYPLLGKVLLQRHRYPLQDDITGGMPVPVVVRLEVVDIKHEEAQRCPGAHGPLQLFGEPLLEIAVYVQPGKTVPDSQLLRLFEHPRILHCNRTEPGYDVQKPQVVGRKSPYLFALQAQHADCFIFPHKRTGNK